MRIAVPLAVALLAAQSGPAFAADPSGLQDEAARMNYSLGYSMGEDFRRQGIELKGEALLKGITDAASGAAPAMTPEEMQSALTALKSRIVAQQEQLAAEEEAKLTEEGKKFLEENGKRPGVVATPSGLQYRIVEPGTGKTPKPTDQVTVHYRGTLIDGEEFDSSYSRGETASFPLDGVVQGWTEGLQLIKEGGKIQLFLPPELGYGAEGPLAHRVLVFDVELISVGAPEQQGDAQATEPK